MANRMYEMKRTRPRQFWKLFKKKQTNIVGEEISIESFQNHFKYLSSQNEDQPHQELEQLTASFDLICYIRGVRFAHLSD